MARSRLDPVLGQWLTIERVVEARVVIRAAARLLTGPERWTRRALARDSRGREVLPDDRAAVRWCLNGALLREGARIDKVELRLRPTPWPGNVGAEDVRETPTGVFAVRVVGLVLAGILIEADEGELVDPSGPTLLRFRGSGDVLPVHRVPEFVNDRRGTSFSDIATALKTVDRHVSRVIRERRAQKPENRRRSPRRGGGDGAA